VEHEPEQRRAEPAAAQRITMNTPPKTVSRMMPTSTSRNIHEESLEPIQQLEEALVKPHVCQSNHTTSFLSD
jgi:hypothetical protein